MSNSHSSDVRVVQANEHTSMLGYEVPYKPKVKVSEAALLPVSTTPRRNSVFSQQRQQSHSSCSYFLQVTCRHTDSSERDNKQQSYRVSVFHFFLFLFLPWPAGKPHVRVMDILVSLNIVPNLLYSIFWSANTFLSFLLAIW